MKCWKRVARQAAALCLALVMCLGMLPGTAFAVDGLTEVEGVETGDGKLEMHVTRKVNLTANQEAVMEWQPQDWVVPLDLSGDDDGRTVYARISQQTQDFISCVLTMEGALAEIHDMLQRMLRLTVEVSNGMNADIDVEGNLTEIAQLRDEIVRVAEDTCFDNWHGLMGGSMWFQSAWESESVGKLLYCDMEDMRSVASALEALDGLIRGMDNSAVDLVSGQIDRVSMQRAELGSRQNMAEHIVAWADCCDENMVANYPLTGLEVGSLTGLGEVDHAFPATESARILTTTRNNALKAIAATQLYEGALVEIHEMLQRQNELAVQAINGTYDDLSVASIRTEVDRLNLGIRYILVATCIDGYHMMNKDGVLTVPVGWSELCHSKAEIKFTDFEDMLVDPDAIGGMAVLDEIPRAIVAVSTQRSEFGAWQNGMEHVVSFCDYVLDNGPMVGNEFSKDENGSHVLEHIEGAFQKEVASILARQEELQEKYDNLGAESSLAVKVQLQGADADIASLNERKTELSIKMENDTLVDADKDKIMSEIRQLDKDIQRVEDMKVKIVEDAAKWLELDRENIRTEQDRLNDVMDILVDLVYVRTAGIVKVQKQDETEWHRDLVLDKTGAYYNYKLHYASQHTDVTNVSVVDYLENGDNSVYAGVLTGIELPADIDPKDMEVYVMLDGIDFTNSAGHEHTTLPDGNWTKVEAVDSFNEWSRVYGIGVYFGDTVFGPELGEGRIGTDVILRMRLSLGAKANSMVTNMPADGYVLKNSVMTCEMSAEATGAVRTNSETFTTVTQPPTEANQINVGSFVKTQVWTDPDSAPDGPKDSLNWGSYYDAPVGSDLHYRTIIDFTASSSQGVLQLLRMVVQHNMSGVTNGTEVIGTAAGTYAGNLTLSGQLGRVTPDWSTLKVWQGDKLVDPGKYRLYTSDFKWYSDNHDPEDAEAIARLMALRDRLQQKAYPYYQFGMIFSNDLLEGAFDSSQLGQANVSNQDVLQLLRDGKARTVASDEQLSSGSMSSDEALSSGYRPIIVMAAGDSKYRVGDAVRYGITLANMRDEGVTVDVSDVLPEGLEFKAVDNKGSCADGRTVVWTGVTVPSKGSVDLWVEAMVLTADPVSNSATVMLDDWSMESNGVVINGPEYGEHSIVVTFDARLDDNAFLVGNDAAGHTIETAGMPVWLVSQPYCAILGSADLEASEFEKLVAGTADNDDGKLPKFFGYPEVDVEEIEAVGKLPDWLADWKYEDDTVVEMESFGESRQRMIVQHNMTAINAMRRTLSVSGVYVTTYGFDIARLDHDGELLEGGTFELLDGDGKPVELVRATVKVRDGDGFKDVYMDGSNNEGRFFPQGLVYRLATENDEGKSTVIEGGRAVVVGLDSGEYRVVDVKAPDGYLTEEGGHMVELLSVGDCMTAYARNNILMQAGQSMLAQANQSPQGVLGLLRDGTDILSSGYRVNQVGDDASSLAISESVRSRINGLWTAWHNVVPIRVDGGGQYDLGTLGLEGTGFSAMALFDYDGTSDTYSYGNSSLTIQAGVNAGDEWKGTPEDPLKGGVPIVNLPGFELPKTGGTGIVPYVAAGCLLAALSGAWFLARKRRRA